MKVEYSEDILYDKVNEKPGLSYYELGKELKWSPAKVRWISKRLKEYGLVYIKKEVTSKVKMKVYPVPALELLSPEARKELEELEKKGKLKPKKNKNL